MKATVNACGLALRSILIETSLTPSMTKKLLVMAALAGDAYLSKVFLIEALAYLGGGSLALLQLLETDTCLL